MKSLKHTEDLNRNRNVLKAQDKRLCQWLLENFDRAVSHLLVEQLLHLSHHVLQLLHGVLILHHPASLDV